MDWLNKSAEQNLDEILHLADINARLRAMSGVEKQADVQEMLGNATGAVKDWAGNATNTVKDWAGKLPEQAREFASAIPGHLTNAGNAVSGWAAKNPWLAAGIGGAGIGGLGMAALNRFNPDEDERDLAGSLSTGAMMGAGLGLGGMALAKHVPGMLSGLSTPAKTENLTQQINEQANAPYLTPLAVDTAAEGAVNTALGTMQNLFIDPAAAAVGNVKHVAANPSLTGAVSGAGGLAAGAIYGNDLLHYLMTRANLARGKGVTDNPDALLQGIQAAIARTTTKGESVDLSKQPLLQRMWQAGTGALTGQHTPAVLTADTRKLLHSISEQADPATLRGLLNAAQRNMSTTIDGVTLSPQLLRSLANSQGYYSGRASTPLRYEAATLAQGLLPKAVSDHVSRGLVKGQPGMPLIPQRVAPTGRLAGLQRAFNGLKGRRMGGVRGLAALAALYGLNSANQGQ